MHLLKDRLPGAVHGLHGEKIVGSDRHHQPREQPGDRSHFTACYAGDALRISRVSDLGKSCRHKLQCLVPGDLHKGISGSFQRGFYPRGIIEILQARDTMEAHPAAVDRVVVPSFYLDGSALYFSHGKSAVFQDRDCIPYYQKLLLRPVAQASTASSESRWKSRQSASRPQVIRPPRQLHQVPVPKKASSIYFHRLHLNKVKSVPTQGQLPICDTENMHPCFLFPFHGTLRSRPSSYDPRNFS